MSTFIQSQNQPVMRSRKALLLLVLLQSASAVVAQDTAQVNTQVKHNQVSFSSVLRPLRQVAGAPESFYSYYWEFGDGNFSFEEYPKHVYKTTGDYNICLYATNNYDDGKPPPMRPKPVSVRSVNKDYAISKNPAFFKNGGAIELKVNRMPKPGEDMVLVMGYRNDHSVDAMDGSMVLFFNEKQFRKDNFDFSEDRVYHNEGKTNINAITAALPPGTYSQSNFYASLNGPNAEAPDQQPFFFGRAAELLAGKQRIFRKNNCWSFSDLKQGEEKFMFITLHTTPEMIKDSNSMVTLTGMFIPNDPSAPIEEYTLELQIVASHDPNRLMLKNRRLSYRFTGTNKEMVYTVRFQNTGKGPARQARIGVGVPEMMDAGSLELIGKYPDCPLCSQVVMRGRSCFDTLITKDSIIFIFRNIYLPGLRQNGFSDPDSTMGFVKFKMHFNRKLKKLPFQSNAAIVFDNNKPVYTNSPRGYFKPGNSPAVMIGYHRSLEKVNEGENYFGVGGAISPYSSFKKYLQAELFAGFLQLKERFEGFATANKDTVIGSTTYHILTRETYATPSIIKLDLVPVQLRYNFSDWVGAGAGTLVTFDAYTHTKFHQLLRVTQPPNPAQTILENNYTTTSWFRNPDVALFVDVQAGRVRVGPVGGLRFLHYFRFPQNALFVYAMWRL